MTVKTRITVSLDDKEYEELVKLSKELDRSLSWIVRQAAASFVESLRARDAQQKDNKEEVPTDAKTAI